MHTEQQVGCHPSRIKLMPDWENTPLWSDLTKRMIIGHTKHIKKSVNLATDNSSCFKQEFNRMINLARAEKEFWISIEQICQEELRQIEILDDKKED